MGDKGLRRGLRRLTWNEEARTKSVLERERKNENTTGRKQEESRAGEARL